MLLWESASQETLRCHVGHDGRQSRISFVARLPDRDIPLEKDEAPAGSYTPFFIDFENRQLARVQTSDPSA